LEELPIPDIDDDDDDNSLNKTGDEIEKEKEEGKEVMEYNIKELARKYIDK